MDKKRQIEQDNKDLSDLARFHINYGRCKNCLRLYKKGDKCWNCNFNNNGDK